MKRLFPSLLLSFVALTSVACAASTPTTPVATQAAALSGSWKGTVGAKHTISLSLKSTTAGLSGEAVMPALAWVDAGTFQVRGATAKSGKTELKLLNKAGEWAYDLTCEPDAAAGAGYLSCVLETWRGGDAMSSARAWKVALQPAAR